MTHLTDRPYDSPPSPTPTVTPSAAPSNHRASVSSLPSIAPKTNKPKKRGKSRNNNADENDASSSSGKPPEANRQRKAKLDRLREKEPPLILPTDACPLNAKAWSPEFLLPDAETVASLAAHGIEILPYKTDEFLEEMNLISATEISKFGESCQAVPEPSFSIALTSTTDKLWLLEDHCTRWHGDISVALAVIPDHPWIISSQPWIDACSRKESSTNRFRNRNVRITPVLVGRQSHFAINKLRNVASDAVTSSHYMTLDMDLLPSRDLHSTMISTYAKYWNVAADPKNILVVPVFEMLHEKFPTGQNLEETFRGHIPENQTELNELLENREAQALHAKGVAGAHSSTPVHKWFNFQNCGDSCPELIRISCVRSLDYEPYFIIQKCPLTPRYHEGFIGRIQNKVEYTHHISFSGYGFYVLPKSFLVHNPHPKRNSLVLDFFQGHKSRIKYLFRPFLNQLNHKYAGVTKRTPECRALRGNSAIEQNNKFDNSTFLEYVYRFAKFKNSNFPAIPKQHAQLCASYTTPTVTLVTIGTPDEIQKNFGKFCTKWSGDLALGVCGVSVLPSEISNICSHNPHRKVRIALVEESSLVTQINAARNFAVELVKTSHYMVLDIDSDISENLHSEITAVLESRKQDNQNQNNFDENLHAILITRNQPLHKNSLGKLTRLNCLGSGITRDSVVLLRKCPFTPEYHQTFLSDSRSLFITQLQYSGYRFSELSIPNLVTLKRSPIIPEETEVEWRCGVSRLIAAFGDTLVPSC
eukprot:c18201_g1_i1.p1 GENE.c18201_g1_i1~~c18201_g1_i1.p1  ORF type:complete len:819 (+),score=164.78 c18201_g1_i1:183-2459(+)